jgi:hypothetical protein
LEALNDLT